MKAAQLTTATARAAPAPLRGLPWSQEGSSSVLQQGVLVAAQEFPPASRRAAHGTLRHLSSSREGFLAAWSLSTRGRDRNLSTGTIVAMGAAEDVSCLSAGAAPFPPQRAEDTIVMIAGSSENMSHD
mmetsp:Transcript_738/g.2236  ORF Transcript_738/g.2236 Transcript_738/m.2236 type:complete len:127 (+) Transcript_738:1153-1533(+)